MSGGDEIEDLEIIGVRAGPVTGDVSGIQCPNCPMCDQPPAFVLAGAVQAFCGNEECRLFVWNPSLTAEVNLGDVGVVDFEGGASQP